MPDPTATGPSRLEGGNGWAVEEPLGSAERAAHRGVVCHEAGKVTAADASSGVGGSHSGKVRSQEHEAATRQLLALQGPPFTRCLPAPSHQHVNYLWTHRLGLRGGYWPLGNRVICLAFAEV